MSKKRKHEIMDIDPTLELPPPSVNWDLCVICQITNEQPLITPRKEGYDSLAVNIATFAEHHTLPGSLIRTLPCTSSSELIQSFVENEAKYHKACRNRYDNQKVKRLIEHRTLSRGRPKSSEEENSSKFKSTRSSCSLPDIKEVCIFCDQSKGDLVAASTLGIGPTIYSHAILLQDQNLLRKLTSTDMVALEAKYHKMCYRTFLNRVRSCERSSQQHHLTNLQQVVYGSVIMELVRYIEDTYLWSETSPVFKLNDITKLVAQRMSNMGVPTNEHDVNRTRLKESLLSFIPGLRADKSGREVTLSFDKDVGDAIKDACAFNDFSDGMCLSRAASILRRELFHDFPKFQGSFNSEFTPAKSIPLVLHNFIRMVLEGPNIEGSMSNEDETSAAALTIGQIIRFNSIKRSRNGTERRIRHSLHSETPFPLYMGLMIHGITKKKKIIDKLFRLGVSVSYDRVQQVTATLTNALCQKYANEDGVVCPELVIPNAFVTAAIDNIDHNQSSSTSSGSFHGSSISIIQHPLNSEDKPESVDISVEHWDNRVTEKLPGSYTSISPCGRILSDQLLPTLNPSQFSGNIPSPHAKLHPWLNLVQHTIGSSEMGNDECRISFACFHSKIQPSHQISKSYGSLLPLLPDEIASSSMVKHTMDIVIAATSRLSPGQIPIITADQPVYAIGKQVQWQFPNRYGENKIVLMMGSLHIEMMIINVLGKWLDGSGWTTVLSDAGIATPGVSESCLTSAHVKRSRYAHEVTLAVLHILRLQAFRESKDSSTDSDDDGLEEWIEARKNASPQFYYWNLVIELESLLLNFIFSIRTSNYRMFMRTLEQICPWAFALDAVHYSRWLPVFIRSLQELPERHPDVYSKFCSGHFTSTRSGAAFSAIADDQYHEQNNKVVKGDGGAIGILDNETALLKWMVAGPILSRLTAEFENKFQPLTIPSGKLPEHHENTKAFDGRYLKHVKELICVVTEQGNPFEGDMLVSLDSRKVIPEMEAVSKMKDAHENGCKQYQEYVTCRLETNELSVHDVIPKNKISIFTAPLKKKTLTREKIKDLRRDSNIFCKLYVASQSRESDVKSFFAHENQPFPPSLSEMGKLRKATNKQDVLTCIDIQEIAEVPSFTAIILDGPAVVHFLKACKCKTFADYYSSVFKPYIDYISANTSRVDVVFDRYLKSSLKNDAREHRGAQRSSIHVRVQMLTLIPKNFDDFLKNNDNKKQLFTILAEQLVQEQNNEKVVVCTTEDRVVTSNCSLEVESISPAWHEEADGRLLLHVKHATENGHTKVCIRTVDSDVVVIAIGVFRQIPNLNELWIDYGIGKYKRFVAIHDICQKMCPQLQKHLPVFHSFTGCDTVSSFCGIGKRTAFKTWMKFREMDTAFQEMSEFQPPMTESTSATIKRFVILMYDRTSHLNDVNECRRFLFTKKNRQIENIPPTEDALSQHVLRAALQAKIWLRCVENNYSPPNPESFGWMKVDSEYVPIWTTIPDIAESCKELVSCTCKKRCSKCKCIRNNLPCTSLCLCEGHCSQSDFLL